MLIWQYSGEVSQIEFHLSSYFTWKIFTADVYCERILFLTLLWGNSFAWLSLHQLFLSFSHINCVSLRDFAAAPPGWPTSLLAHLGWPAAGGETCQADACFCLLPWFKQRGILTGLRLLAEVGYDERWLPCERTDSVTQNACALPLFGENCFLSSHPPPPNTSISFFVHFCLRRWTAVTGRAAKLEKLLPLKTKKIWIPLG